MKRLQILFIVLILLIGTSCAIRPAPFTDKLKMKKTDKGYVYKPQHKWIKAQTLYTGPRTKGFF